MRGAVLVFAALLFLGSLPAHPADSLTARVERMSELVARRAYDEVLAIAKELVPALEAAGDEAGLARALFYAARSHYFKTDYRAAMPLFERSLAASRKAGDRAFEAEVLRGITRLHKQQGTYREGLRTAEQSIALYEELGLTREAARTWMTVGAIRDLSGEFDKALAAYRKSLAGLGNLKDDEYYTLYNELAITYTNLGRYEEALKANFISLEGRERAGDAYLIGISHSNIGNAYYSLGQYQRAIEHHERCLELCGASGERRAIAVALGTLATDWIALGDGARALEYAQRELALTRELDLKPLEGVALRHLGRGYALQGKLDESVAHYQQALALSREAGALSDEAETLMALANVELKRGHPQAARAFAERALPIAQRTHAPDLDWEGRLVLARAARATGDTDEALEQLRASVQVIDSLRGRVHTDAGKIGYLDARQAAYHELADLLQERGQVREALEVAEAARGRAFSDLLVAQTLSLKPADAELLAGIRATEARLRAEGASAGEDEAANALLAQTRAAGEAELAGRIERMRSQQPELASLIAADPVKVSDLAAIAHRLDATMIEYLVTEQRLLIWVIAPDGEVSGWSVKVDRDTLRRSTRALRTRMNNLTAKDLRAPGAVRTELAQLHRWLIEPVAAQLPRRPDALVQIVPHDALLLVPFAALLDARGRYLVERHTLATIPSAGVLRYTARKQRHAARDDARFLGFADPEPPQGAVQDALPGARAEIRQLARRFPADRRLALSGEHASEANAKRLAPGQTLLHFAVHGVVRDDRPWESALLLAPGDGEDGWFRLPEVFGLDLHADLVVLSGCSTGLGKVSGDGVVGLARALMYAGAPSVVVSHWDVSDLATAFLMDRFYAALASGRGKAHALRAAQLATLERHPHPALWAAFFLVGEPE